MFFANGRPLQHKRGLVAKSHFESWPQRISGVHSESECRGKVASASTWNIKSNHLAQQLSCVPNGSGCTCCRRSFGQSFPSRRWSICILSCSSLCLYVSRRAAAKIQSSQHFRRENKQTRIYTLTRNQCVLP